MGHLKKSTKIKYIVLIIIFVISFIASSILSFLPPEEICGGTSTGCYEVQESEYKETLGIENSYFGLVLFPLLTLLAVLHMKYPKKIKKRLLTLLITLGTIFAIYFLYLQFFIIHAICKYCMVVDIGFLISIGIMLIWKE